MTNIPNIAIKVVETRGECHEGHKVGDEWICNGTTPKGMCSMAFCALYPTIWALQFGAKFPWQKDQHVARGSCPDPESFIIFELRRLTQE